MRCLAPLALVLALALPAVARAEPRVGDALPSISLRDLRARPHDTRELRGRPAVLIVLTDRDASALATPWIVAARARYGASGVRVVTLVSVDLPPFATTGMARAFARRNEEPRYWGQVWLDRSAARRALGVEPGSQPGVLVVDGQGHVAASVRGTLSPERARAVWSAADALRRTASR